MSVLLCGASASVCSSLPSYCSSDAAAAAAAAGAVGTLAVAEMRDVCRRDYVVSTSSPLALLCRVDRVPCSPLQSSSDDKRTGISSLSPCNRRRGRSTSCSEVITV